MNDEQKKYIIASLKKEAESLIPYIKHGRDTCSIIRKWIEELDPETREVYADFAKKSVDEKIETMKTNKEDEKKIEKEAYTRGSPLFHIVYDLIENYQGKGKPLKETFDMLGGEGETEEEEDDWQDEIPDFDGEDQLESGV